MFSSSSTWKILQKQTYDVLSHKCSFLILCIAFTTILVSAFHFGETWLTWSRKKYDSFFSAFSENIVGKSLQNELCHHVPIDIVYTWVNGSDPELLKDLMKLRLEGKNSDGIPSSPHVNDDITSKNRCGLKQCIPSRHIALKCQLPRHASLISIRSSHASLASVTEVRILDTVEKSQSHWTLISFPSEEAVLSALISLTQSSPWSSQNCSAHHAYWTVEEGAPLSYVMPRTVLVNGLPSTTSLSHLVSSPLGAYVAIDHILLYSEEGIAVITLPSIGITNEVLKLNGNLTILGKVAKVHRASLILELPSTENLGDFSPSRFDDKEELRYSLRSVEQFAPWVRHIWLVTNGQIPHWINLEHPRLTIITHEEIFPNGSHLPTFGSPAIESHLHRIPGLSEKFLYLNDDMLFGKEVWPDDFYTTAYGQKVYLSWPVPECHEGCPPLWIGDGYCDRACNHSECHWDGGDCLPGNEASAKWMGTGSRAGAAKRGDADALEEDDDAFQRADEDGELWGDGGNNNEVAEVCGSHCTDSWLADKYCDINCNTLACGFDAGDCGTSHFQDMPAFDLLPNIKKYTVPEGALSVFWNLTNFMKDGSEILQGEYSESKAVRVMALSIKLFTITLVLKPGFNDTTIFISLKGKRNGDSIKVDFNVTFNTMENHSLPISKGQKTSLLEKLKSSTQVSHQHSTSTMISVNEGKRFIQITPFAKGIRLAPKVLMKEKVITALSNWTTTLSNSTQKLKINDFDSNNLKIFNKKLNTQENSDIHSITHLKLRSLRGLEQVKGSKKYIQGKRFPEEDIHLPLDSMEDPIVSVGHENPIGGQRWMSRKLHDSFADSLLYVNRLYDKAYGLEARKVPAHMAHLIDRRVMEELQARFPSEWDETSSHKVRSPRDMQYAFSYFYFLMSEKITVTVAEIFDTFDTDHSGTWSDREIRTVLARIYDHPLTYDKVLRFERTLINCSHFLPLDESINIPSNERYMDSKLPIVSKSLIVGCHPVSETLAKKFGKRHRFKYQVVGDEEVAFKMLSSDLNSAIAQLDDVRKRPRKFVCLNDNLDPHQPKNNDKVRILLRDLFEALYPKPSSFELPPEYRNRFLKMSELQEWRTRRAWLRMVVYVSIGILIIFSLTNFFHNEVIRVWKKLTRHPRNRRVRAKNKTKDITYV